MRRSLRHSVLALVALSAGLSGAATAQGPAVAAGTAYLPKALAILETPRFAANYSQIGERFASPAVGDVDGDGVPDIVAGTPDGHVYAWRTDNGALWFDHFTGAGAVQASPGLVDYDHDGRLDIVYANTGGDIGVVTWDRRTLFHAKIGRGGSWDGALATPAVRDLDNDGRLEVVVSGFDQYLHAWGPGIDPPERAGFPVHLQDTSWSSPAVADIDGDGRDEIVVGWDCDGAPGQACSPGWGGYIGAFNDDGTRVPGWPKFVQGQVVWSSPALADLDGDGRLDVVVGTGNMDASMWDGGKHPMRGTQVFGLRADGSTLPGWPVTVGRNVTSSPAVGDVTGDGRPEVAFVAEDGLLYVYGGDGRLLWKRCAGNDVDLPPNDGTLTYGSECPFLHASPSIADVYGDGRQEVVVGGEQWVHVFDGATGGVVARGETIAGALPMSAAPALVNVGGQAWIVEVSGTGSTGRIFAWRTGKALGDASWPGFKGSAARTGALGASAPTTVGGKIGERWTALGGRTGTLGAPTSAEFDIPNGRGQRFAGGDIYWSGSTGAHEVYGAILDRYRRLGGPSGRLGLPTTGEAAAPGGRVSAFQAGSVYWSPGTGAWSVQGLILDRYRALGGPGGTLGFPVQDEAGTPGGRVSRFLNGVAFWSPGTGAHAVQGAILVQHTQLGGTAGLLGFPTTDELAVAGGRTSRFTRGEVLWSGATGAHEVHGLILETYRARGGAGGPLGLPRSDEYPVPGGARSDFQGGGLRYDAARGVVVSV